MSQLWQYCYIVLTTHNQKVYGPSLSTNMIQAASSHEINSHEAMTTSIIEPNTKFLAIKVHSFNISDQEVVTTIPHNTDTSDRSEDLIWALIASL